MGIPGTKRARANSQEASSILGFPSAYFSQDSGRLAGGARVARLAGVASTTTYGRGIAHECRSDTWPELAADGNFADQLISANKCRRMRCHTRVIASGTNLLIVTRLHGAELSNAVGFFFSKQPTLPPLRLSPRPACRQAGPDYQNTSI